MDDTIFKRHNLGKQAKNLFFYHAVNNIFFIPSEQQQVVKEEESFIYLFIFAKSDA